MRNLIITILAVLNFVVPAVARDVTDGAWRITFETTSIGPVDAVVRFERSGNVLKARTTGVTSIAIDFEEKDDGTFAGPVVSGKPGPAATLRVDGERLTGAIDKGILRGDFHAVSWSGDGPLRDYPAIVKTLDRVMKMHLYDPALLDADGWKTFRAEADGIASSAKDDFDLIMGIRSAWKNDPFSHFQVRRSAVSVEEMMKTFDGMRMGRETVHLTFRGDVAILVVDTMMGVDTIEQIEKAYEEIARRSPKALVIDVRENDGGAFAVVPLVQHVIREPLEAGAFLGSRWWGSSRSLPTIEQIERVEPWTGWSLISFWRDAQERTLLRLRFEPQEPRFEGKVFVLTASGTASAAELAVDALRASGQATIVGEKTAGHMLSGSYFEVSDGYMVFLPVADYISRRVGRIDGAGLTPDVAVPAAEALDRAIALAVE